MKAAVTILGGGDKKTIQPGEEIPEGYFTEEELEEAKANGIIEGEGPNAEDEESVEGKMAPSEAKATADLQAQERLSAPAAKVAAEKQAEADKAEAEAKKADAEAAKKEGT